MKKPKVLISESPEEKSLNEEQQTASSGTTDSSKQSYNAWTKADYLHELLDSINDLSFSVTELPVEDKAKSILTEQKIPPKAQYKRVSSFDEDEENPEENNSLSYIRRSKKNKLNPISSTNKLSINDDLLHYFDDPDENKASLLKYLVKSSLINEGSNCMEFDPAFHKNGLQGLRSSFSGAINNTANSIYNNIYILLTNFNVKDTDTNDKVKEISKSLPLSGVKLMQDIIDIIESIYLSKLYDKHFMYIDSKEVLFEIVKGCLDRNIKVEKGVKNCLRLDFTELRSNRQCLRIAYFRSIEEVFLVDKISPNRYNSMSDYMSRAFKDIPIVIKPIINKEENSIIINNMVFSKSVLENIVESSFEVFIENLEIEQFIHENENSERRIGGGDNDSLQDLKLL